MVHPIVNSLLGREAICPRFILSDQNRLLDDWTALHLGSSEGHTEIARMLLENGANIESKTSMWRTPLHIACLRGYLEMTKLLIEFKANINATDKDFCTPLHYASEHGYCEILEFLLAHKPDALFKNHAGLSAYDICLNIETRRIFEKYDIATDALVSTFGRTALDDFIIFNSRTDYVGKILHEFSYRYLLLLCSFKYKKYYHIFRGRISTSTTSGKKTITTDSTKTVAVDSTKNLNGTDEKNKKQDEIQKIDLKKLDSAEKFKYTL